MKNHSSCLNEGLPNRDRSPRSRVPKVKFVNEEHYRLSRDGVKTTMSQQNSPILGRLEATELQKKLFGAVTSIADLDLQPTLDWEETGRSLTGLSLSSPNSVHDQADDAGLLP